MNWEEGRDHGGWGEDALKCRRVVEYCYLKTEREVIPRCEKVFTEMGVGNRGKENEVICSLKLRIMKKPH